LLQQHQVNLRKSVKTYKNDKFAIALSYRDTFFFLDKTFSVSYGFLKSFF